MYSNKYFFLYTFAEGMTLYQGTNWKDSVFFSFFLAVPVSRTKMSTDSSFQGSSPNHQNDLQGDLREAQNINI